jgi:hypothetical protein
MWTDRRFAGNDQLWLCPPRDAFVRVPDQILKTAVFLGLDGPAGKEYGGTGYIVAVDYGPGYQFTEKLGGITTTTRQPFWFLVTAAHVAEKLEGLDFYIRANAVDGSLAELKQDCENTQWWYHPTERDAVDAAAMLLPIEAAMSLDIVSIPSLMFVGDETIKASNLGVGDEVFIAGLFKKAKGTSRNIPIIRYGNVAMMPKEKIPFPTKERPDQWLYADLLESRSIGGLSGSPVFIRETVELDTGKIQFVKDFSIVGVNSPNPYISGMESIVLRGLGRFHFFGSLIGHWQVDVGFNDTQVEAVNFGIAPMVPAQKILEVLSQPELLETMNKISANLKEQQQQTDGFAVMDSGFRPTQKTEEGYEIPVPTKDEFFAALQKVSRKRTPKK